MSEYHGACQRRETEKVHCYFKWEHLTSKTCYKFLVKRLNATLHALKLTIVVVTFANVCIVERGSFGTYLNHIVHEIKCTQKASISLWHICFWMINIEWSVSSLSLTTLQKNIEHYYSSVLKWDFCVEWACHAAGVSRQLPQGRARKPRPQLITTTLIYAPSDGITFLEALLLKPISLWSGFGCKS